MSVETKLDAAERAALAREARWQRLLHAVDPENAMTEVDREDAARQLRREQLGEYGRLGRVKQAEQQAAYRMFLERKGELIRLHEEIVDLLRGDAQ